MCHQATLQFKARETGQPIVELIPESEESDPGARGFRRLPAPDEGDIFFDMEGNPLEDGGLEYLFGAWYYDKGQPKFQSFWAHTRAEEKKAFEGFMDFAVKRLARFPNAHIFHYASYEQTAIKRLMTLHGTREAEVDNLLRYGKLVDLYKVVKESIRVSEPSYSIKNIEKFYLDQRAGEVKNAGASIVYYEKWKDTGESKLLQEIEDYNREDVRSTSELNKWLLQMRPKNMPWFDHGKDAPIEPELTDAEKRLIPYRERLVDPLAEDRALWGVEEHHRELTYQLLDFHRRADKPQWWAMFDRKDMTVDERFEDLDCIVGLTRDPQHPPVPEKQSIRHTYVYPEQETKLKTGDSFVNIDTTEPLNEVVLDEEARRVSFKVSTKREPPPATFDIGLGGPISSEKIKDAVFRYGTNLVHQIKDGAPPKYPAIDSFLKREIPAISHVTPGQPIIDERASDRERQIIRAVAGLQQSYLFIQGPPGAGKTYTGSRVIVELLRQGKRVGVSSNSHKAIINLLKAVETYAIDSGVRFRGVKKSSKTDTSTHVKGDTIADVFDNKAVFAGNYDLVAGTAWLFSDSAMDQKLDYIFVDEAGQVSLANLVGMGTSAKNIVLLGDQMQLSQPVQGVHPGLSGESALDYLLEGRATIPQERGIFLKTTWRLHPDICKFISEAVYDGRLLPEAKNFERKLALNSNGHPALMSAGIRHIPIEHEGCSQTSIEEAALIKSIYENLLSQKYTGPNGELHPVTADNILIVAPYNMQVAALKRELPANARVGTVDKFQGQEAEVVLVSMTTSSGEDLPRYIEFLYSKNRLNVAVSRAKCLAIVIANPALMSIQCNTPEQMALVNTLCWLSSGDAPARGNAP